MHVPEPLTLVVHQSFLPVDDVLGTSALFLQALGGIDLLRLGHGERFLDGGDESPEQQTGDSDTENEDQYSFRIFHRRHSIK